jgi:biotin synthase
MKQMREGVAAIKAEVDIQVAASLGMLSKEQVDELVDMGVHRYNPGLETCRSTSRTSATHSWEERWETLRMVRESGMEVCCGGILGAGETVEQRAESSPRSSPSWTARVPLNSSTPAPAPAG